MRRSVFAGECHTRDKTDESRYPSSGVPCVETVTWGCRPALAEGLRLVRAEDSRPVDREGRPVAAPRSAGRSSSWPSAHPSPAAHARARPGADDGRNCMSSKLGCEPRGPRLCLSPGPPCRAPSPTRHTRLQAWPMTPSSPWPAHVLPCRRRAGHIPWSGAESSPTLVSLPSARCPEECLASSGPLFSLTMIALIAGDDESPPAPGPPGPAEPPAPAENLGALTSSPLSHPLTNGSAARQMKNKQTPTDSLVISNTSLARIPSESGNISFKIPGELLIARNDSQRSGSRSRGRMLDLPYLAAPDVLTARMPSVRPLIDEPV